MATAPTKLNFISVLGTAPLKKPRHSPTICTSATCSRSRRKRMAAAVVPLPLPRLQRRHHPRRPLRRQAVRLQPARLRRTRRLLRHHLPHQCRRQHTHRPLQQQRQQQRRRRAARNPEFARRVAMPSRPNAHVHVDLATHDHCVFTILCDVACAFFHAVAQPC